MERTDMGALTVESRPAEHWWHLTEWLRLGGTSGGRLVQPSAPAGPPQSCLPSTTSWQLLKISREETAPPLDSLCQGLVTPSQKCLLMFRWNLLHFSLCPMPLILSLGTTVKSLVPSSPHVFAHIDQSTLSLLLQAEQPQLSAFPHRKDAPPVPAASLWSFFSECLN